MPLAAWAFLAYACAVAYSYVHLHNVYGRTHIFAALFWPFVGVVLTVLRLGRALIHHFTSDGKQLGK